MTFIKRIGFCTALLSASLASHSHAMGLGCEWETHPGPMLFSMNLGSFFVPRDAEIGTVIGSIGRIGYMDPVKPILACDNDGTLVLNVDIFTNRPIFPGTLPPAGGWDVNGKVMETSIPGVGLYVRLGSSFGGTANNQFQAVDGNPAVPFLGINNTAHAPIYQRVELLLSPYTALIKTGPIPAGTHSFNHPVFQATASDVGDAFRTSASATVTQAQCTLKADAVSADPVELGKHVVADFTGVGTTTAPVDFQIRLNDCEDDPNGSTARAHIRLDGVQGSTSIDNALGLFTLTQDSTASGIGIQVLQSDGSPLKLEENVALDPLTVGVTQLSFSARYYQTAALVTPGLAKGALTFTISYR